MTGQLWGSYGVPDYGLSLSHGRVLFLREVEDDIELFIVDRQGSISWRRRYSSSEFRVTTGSGEPARLGILGSPWILSPNGVLFSTVTFDRRMWAYPSGVSAIYLGDDVEPDFLTRPDMGWAATNSVLPDELDRVAREPAPPRQ